MDHVLNGMQSYYEIVLDQFVVEQRSGNHKKLSENPFYYEVKALVNSMNILRKYMGWAQIRLKDEVDFNL